MKASDDVQPPPGTIYGENIRLQFSHRSPGNPAHSLVPTYHLRIVDLQNTDVGHINLRIGDTPHILQVVGHIGYEIIPPQRGHGYAEKACRAIAPFAAKFYHDVIITAAPDNLVSLHIIEKLGARFLDEIVVPKHDPTYANGDRRKRRYCWNIRSFLR